MLNWIEANPGRLYVVATLLPLLGFSLLLIAGLVRNLCRPYRQVGGFASTLYWLLGGDKPLTSGAYLATTFMAASAAMGIAGLVWFHADLHNPELTDELRAARWAERVDWIRIGQQERIDAQDWARRETNPDRPEPATAQALELGYRIDHLTALMFAMVTVIGTGIFIFSIGYMKDETLEIVEDHEVHRQSPSKTHAETHTVHPAPPHPATTNEIHSHFQRRGRFSRFFLYLSLFCFSMLNLIVADNLFQVFVSWELVGVCSYFLIGFYYERPSAGRAANKAFIVNRIGDVGFLVGLLIAWTSLGTLNFEEMNRRVRSPKEDTHGHLDFADQLVRVNLAPEPDRRGNPRYRLPPKGESAAGSNLALFPILWEDPHHFHGLGYASQNDKGFSLPPKANATSYSTMPYWLFIVMGIGIFLGCVGKSAQVPLHTWLPDAMEGPTPVSALIHAATMVAAGVYLVGRVFPLFAPEVLLVIAYTGAITLFVAATIAVVQTDIKRVLAYSTCSQLGFMMLALGVGGWVAGLFHLLTHAFFKALLFLCAGSVIHGCHHEQDLRKMGGLRRKMPITAFTMLVGVLAISGTPFFSGWYSKDEILAAALGYGLTHPEHALLLVLPMITAGLTAYYMFRLWFLAFTGNPREEHVHSHAHESPWVMTLPLIILAIFSLGVAWGWPLWEVEQSYLGHFLEEAKPAAAKFPHFAPELAAAHENHSLAGFLALAVAFIGAAVAYVAFARRQPDLATLSAPLHGVLRFFRNRWYFDEAYDAAVVRPTVKLAFATAAADKQPTELVNSTDRSEPKPKSFDLRTLDGIMNTLGQATGALGRSLRVFQTGRIRGYALALGLTVAAMLGILTILNR